MNACLDGFNGTIFAYGQTSSGKTHTMQGSNIHSPKDKGIVPRMVTSIFQSIEDSPDYVEWQIKVSVVEIYMEKIRDLLDITKENLKIRECSNKGIFIEDVTEVYVEDVQNIYDLVDAAHLNRHVGHTNMNEGSSRSHLIFLMHIFQQNSKENYVINSFILRQKDQNSSLLILLEVRRLIKVVQPESFSMKQKR